MTTIAFRKGKLAADKRSTRNGQVVSDAEVKIGQENGYLFGAAGSLSQCQRFITWAKDNCKGDPPPMTRARGLIIYPDRALVYSDYPRPKTIHVPANAFYAAIGSGSGHALKAMAEGADPVEAIQLASQLDPHTGAETDSLFLPLPPLSHPIEIELHL